MGYELINTHLIIFLYNNFILVDWFYLQNNQIIFVDFCYFDLLFGLNFFDFDYLLVDLFYFFNIVN